MAHSGPPIIIGYARVSTDEQNANLQIDALQRAGCDKIFIEKQSGAIRERPELQRALTYSRTGDTFMVWKIDRMARSISHLCDILERFRARNIILKSLTEPVDTSTPVGRAMLQIIGVFAELERSILKERQRAGIAAARARGGRLGRKPKHSRSTIIEACRSVEQGKATVREIAAVLHIDLSTMYRYVGNYRNQRVVSSALPSWNKDHAA